ncbi:hypothetical protein DB347_23235 [Opitutaceae bacterium EW11]|nr:hypothetical protein DB347_23235 [Opitutaceae bacterium EW11]
MSTPPVPYLLLFRDAPLETYSSMSSDQRAALLQRWNDWFDGIAAKGQMVDGRPLHNEGRVVSGPRGERIVDGPFAEAKEAVAGYFLINVSGADEATAIAQQCPMLPYGMTVEVRPVAGACHLALSLGRTTMKECATA